MKTDQRKLTNWTDTSGLRRKLGDLQSLDMQEKRRHIKRSDTRRVSVRRTKRINAVHVLVITPGCSYAGVSINNHFTI